jgi:hypothetical protein
LLSGPDNSERLLNRYLSWVNLVFFEERYTSSTITTAFGSLVGSNTFST